MLKSCGVSPLNAEEKHGQIFKSNIEKVQVQSLQSQISVAQKNKSSIGTLTFSALAAGTGEQEVDCCGVGT